MSMMHGFPPHNFGGMQPGFQTPPHLQSDDSRVHAEFYIRSVLNGPESNRLSRPVHDNVEYIKIQQAGERECLDRPAHDGDRMRFQQQYAIFKRQQAGEKEAAHGTPLVVLFPDDPAIVMTFKYHGVHTVEQLADISDTGKQAVGMGAQMFSDRARQFLGAAAGGKEFQAVMKRLDLLEGKLQEKDARIVALEADNARMNAELGKKAA